MLSNEYVIFEKGIIENDTMEILFKVNKIVSDLDENRISIKRMTQTFIKCCNL